ncbi:hypothetical protein NYE80_19875 [Paenibacillus sp. FSL H7-0357]|uniref:hypothetical protein n=1 Tax=Paenibacillus sp. FSL H7-0357 TaxID=1536774 RepID=UPI000A99F90D|nr:hypothetical protein [Paenibacillus sp. FSL H7-0357]
MSKVKMSTKKKIQEKVKQLIIPSVVPGDTYYMLVYLMECMTGKKGTRKKRLV